MRKLPPLPALRVFEAAARHSSFKDAAAELGVTPAAISHQIRLIEDTLQVRLFHRGVRSVHLSREGQVLYPALRVAFDGIAAALAEIQKPRRQVLTLSATPLFLSRWLVPRIDSFREMYPEIDLRLIATLEPADLAGGEADAAIRYGRGPYPGLHARVLAEDRFVPMCSGSLGLESASGLRDHLLLHSQWRVNGRDAPTWQRWASVAGIDGVDWSRGVTFTDESHAIQAAIAGKGVALLSPLLVSDELEAGSLVQPFGPSIPGLRYHFVRAEGAAPAARCEPLERWLSIVMPQRL